MPKTTESRVSALALADSEGEAFTTAAPSAASKGKQLATVDSELDPPQNATIARSTTTTPKSLHAIAGGLGGLAGGVVTAPFDVVKTRLQSNLFSDAVKASSHSATTKGTVARTRELLYHLVETGIILRDIGKNEGIPALFRGLGPTLVGAIPARSINFFTYGNGKHFYADTFNNGQESAAVHLVSAATAGIVTATATNPIWVVKTRLQLQDSLKRKANKSSSTNATSSARSAAKFSSLAAIPGGKASALFTPSFGRSQATVAAPQLHNGSLSCILHIWKAEGLKGFYRGLSASYLGVAEGTIQWTLYEQFKALRQRRGTVREQGWIDKVGAAGAAKLIATIITYPHEVVRTRLRQAPPPGWSQPKYYGLVQTFRLVWREEGMAALYGGLAPHLLRVVPNAAVMYTIYEFVLKFGSKSLPA